MFAKLGEQIYENFNMVDFNNNPVTSEPPSAFTRTLFDPSGNEVSKTIPGGVTITEMTSGSYRVLYTPTCIGKWFIVIVHPDYFPWGKAGETKIYENDFDTLQSDITKELERLLGLAQENYFLDQCGYNVKENLTSGRIRIYSDPNSVGTDNDVTDTYQITTTYNAGGCKMLSYKVVKI